MQYVSCDGHISEHLWISCGVLQGSVLGPHLFTMYVNDMCNVSKLLKFISLFYSHSHLPNLVDKLCTELK